MSSPLYKLIVLSDLSEVSPYAAEQFISLSENVIRNHERFAVALSGGSTPKHLYSLLSEEPYRSRIDWSRIHFFWGDERCVPPDHAESNYRMANEALLNRVPVPPQNVHRIRGEESIPAKAAADYEAELKDFFGHDKFPRFDLIYLGIGEDGHTASLFPGTSGMQESKRWVVENFVPKLNAFRITLTLPVINNAAEIVFLVAGSGKSHILKQVLNPQHGIAPLPSQQIHPLNGRLIFVVDSAAAKEL